MSRKELERNVSQQLYRARRQYNTLYELNLDHLPVLLEIGSVYKDPDLDQLPSTTTNWKVIFTKTLDDNIDSILILSDRDQTEDAVSNLKGKITNAVKHA